MTDFETAQRCAAEMWKDDRASRSLGIDVAVTALGAVGYGIALIYVLFSAPDLAIAGRALLWGKTTRSAPHL